MSFKSTLEHVGKQVGNDAKKVDHGLQEAGKEVAKGQQTVQKYTGGKPDVQSGPGQPPVQTD